MARRPLLDIVHYLRRLARPDGAGGPGDAELLERYVQYRDEAAFELLVWRHGVMVLNVCRRILRSEQDIEDAFQATFLALVRKAPSIVRRGSIASWLYKVAYRIALEARARAQKIAVRERPGGELLAVQTSADPAGIELRSILDEELNRLPERLRRPFVLCYLEGKSNEEAARELGCRLGTIWSRLARGREMLRHRLMRRGVTLSTAALTAALAEHAAEAAPTAILVRSAAATARAFAGPSACGADSSRAATLAEGVLRTMFVNKIKMTVGMLLAVGLLAMGGAVTHHVLRAEPQAKAKSKPSAAAQKSDDKKISVRVIKPKAAQLTLKQQQEGAIQASQQQQVVPLISGTIAEVRVNIGDTVKKGDVLVVLEAPLRIKAEEEAAAAVEIAQAREEEARAQIAVAEAQVLDTDRLLKNNERVELATVRAKLNLAKAARKAAAAGVRATRATLEKARIQVEFTRLRAAFDGVVTRRNADPGNYVQVSDSRLLTPLLTVQQIDPVRVVIDVNWEFAPFIERGMVVELSDFALSKRRIAPLKISRFSPTIVQGEGMRVEIDVPNADRAFLPGMRGIAILHLKKSSTQALVVPSDCVRGSTDGTLGALYVFIVRDGKAHRVPIEVEVGEREQMAIRGVKASDLIAISNLSQLKEGTPVQIEKGP